MNLGIYLFKGIEFYFNRKKSREHIATKNLVKFRKFVKYAQKNSPFYGKIIRENNINCNTCTHEDFPILTKDILMQNFDDIVTDKNITKQKVMDFLSASKDSSELLDNKFYVVHTSGSSGTVGYFVYSKKDWARSAEQNVTADNLVVPVLYPDEIFDLNNEYDPITSTFTPKQNGVYSIIAGVNFAPVIDAKLL